MLSTVDDDSTTAGKQEESAAGGLDDIGDELGDNRTAWESSAGAGSPSWLAQIQRDAKKAKDKEKAESQLSARGRILNAEKTA